MQILIHIPDEIAQTLAAERPNLPQAAIEALAMEGYRKGLLSEHQVQKMLDLKTRMQVHAFLKENRVPLNYSLADLDQDVKSLALFEERLPV
jgi:predicted HTH domain antitoxin